MAADPAISCVGGRMPRVEDRRFMDGSAQYVADITLSGMLDVAFLRSPVSSGKIRAIDVPDNVADSVLTAARIEGLGPIRADASVAGFRPAHQPILAQDRVRFEGEALAAAFAATRAQAEDILDRVELRLEPLEPVLDVIEARRQGAPRVHQGWPDNAHVESQTRVGDLTLAGTEVTVTRSIRSARQGATPMECRGIVAAWDDASESLTAWISTQAPHIFRAGLARTLAIPQRSIRVVAPDVGGGFGYKGVLLPEEVLVCWLAMTRRGTFRWIQDRRENLITGANCREYATTVTLRADRHGKIRAVEADAAADAGAYSAFPFTACLEGIQLGGLIAGPYHVEGYEARASAIATNKPPSMPFRGTARPGACLVTELAVDALARAVGREPWQVRMDNLIAPSQMPYHSLTGKNFDNGDYPALLLRLVERMDIPDMRAAQASGNAGRLRRGVGLAFYYQQAAYGAKVFQSLGIAGTPGFEQLAMTLLPDGEIELRTGVQSHGQGMETSLAQVVVSELGVAIDRLVVRHGDTAASPFSTGTYGSRCGVIVSGAVTAACAELKRRCARIAAHLLQAEEDEVVFVAGGFTAASGSVSFAEIARIWYERPYELPRDADPMGLDVVIGHRPEPEDGTFGFGAHGARVTVDIETGRIAVDDYAIVTDAGRMINPLIVEGQVYGAWAQGVGTALFEAARYEAGVPASASLQQYILPSAADLTEPMLEMRETPSVVTSHGQKGVGEAATIPVGPTLANAINDALKDDDVEILEVPILPATIRAAVRKARL